MFFQTSEFLDCEDPTSMVDGLVKAKNHISMLWFMMSENKLIMLEILKVVLLADWEKKIQIFFFACSFVSILCAGLYAVNPLFWLLAITDRIDC